MAHSYLCFNEKKCRIHDDALIIYLMFIAQEALKWDKPWGEQLLSAWKDEIHMSGFMDPKLDVFFNTPAKKEFLIKTLTALKNKTNPNNSDYIIFTNLPFDPKHSLHINTHQLSINNFISLLS